MDGSTTRMFTLSRVLALALIALLVAGLAYLRFAPESSSVSVPDGREGRRSDPRALRVPDRERQLRRRMRHARRTRETSRPAVAPDRSPCDPDPCHVRSSS